MSGPFLRLCLILALVCATACGVRPGAAAPAGPRIIDTRSGADVGVEEVLRLAADARVLLVGERHDRPADHALQVALARGLARRGGLAIGFEMVQRPYQLALDAFVEGQIGEAAMLERVEWEERWGYDYEMYRPLFALGQEGVRLVALNAPRELSRALVSEGVDGLAPEMRALLPEMDLEVASHRAAVAAALADHPGMSDAMMERFYLAQVLWDETMAQSVAEVLAGERPPSRVLVVAGAMHVRRDAIPHRLSRRGVGAVVAVTPVAEAALEEALADPPARFLYVTAD